MQLAEWLLDMFLLCILLFASLSLHLHRGKCSDFQEKYYTKSINYWNDQAENKHTWNCIANIRCSHFWKVHSSGILISSKNIAMERGKRVNCSENTHKHFIISSIQINGNNGRSFLLATSINWYCMRELTKLDWPWCSKRFSWHKEKKKRVVCSQL